MAECEQKWMLIDVHSIKGVASGGQHLGAGTAPYRNCRPPRPRPRPTPAIPDSIVYALQSRLIATTNSTPATLCSVTPVCLYFFCAASLFKHPNRPCLDHFSNRRSLISLSPPPNTYPLVKVSIAPAWMRWCAPRQSLTRFPPLCRWPATRSRPSCSPASL